MTQPRFIVFDTETTGLSRHSERILEIAAMEFDPQTGKTGRYFHAYINPQKFIPPKLTQLHGVTNAFVADKPVFSEVAEYFIRFVKDATLVAHNASFDVGFLNAEFARLGLNELSNHVAEVVCTRSMARKAFPGQPASLDALCDVFAINRSHRTLHGALVDCELLAEVYPRLVQAVAVAPPKPQKPRKRAPPKAPAPVPEQAPAASNRQSFLNKLRRWFSTGTKTRASA